MSPLFRLLTILFGLLLALPQAFAQQHEQPARVEGLWCGIGLLHEFSLQIHQQHQDFDALLQRKGRSREVTGRIDGSRLVTDPQKNVVLELKAMGDELRITNGTGQFALARGQGFSRAPGASCGA